MAHTTDAACYDSTDRQECPYLHHFGNCLSGCPPVLGTAPSIFVLNPRLWFTTRARTVYNRIRQSIAQHGSQVEHDGVFSLTSLQVEEEALKRRTNKFRTLRFRTDGKTLSWLLAVQHSRWPTLKAYRSALNRCALHIALCILWFHPLQGALCLTLTA